MIEIRGAIFEMVRDGKPMTVRQVFYRGVSASLWSKTEAEYKQTVCRLLAEMRRDGTLPYSWIADSTRWQRRPTTYSSVEDALAATARTYRRSLWNQTSRVVEVWLEKEALAGVLVGITDHWDVPLMVTRGYPSLSFLHSAGSVMGDRCRRNGQATSVLYLGDRDPSGDDIARKVDEDLRGFAGADAAEMFEFTRLAVTAGQVAEYDLPTRPTKRSDSRARSWDGDGSVEVDAIDPDELRFLVDSTIATYVDPHQLEILEEVEAQERQVLNMLSQRVRLA